MKLEYKYDTKSYQIQKLIYLQRVDLFPIRNFNYFKDKKGKMFVSVNICDLGCLDFISKLKFS